MQTAMTNFFIKVDVLFFVYPHAGRRIRSCATKDLRKLEAPCHLSRAHRHMSLQLKRSQESETSNLILLFSSYSLLFSVFNTILADLNLSFLEQMTKCTLKCILAHLQFSLILSGSAFSPNGRYPPKDSIAFKIVSLSVSICRYALSRTARFSFPSERTSVTRALT